MTEINFVPSWYSAAQRRNRWLKLHAWSILTLGAGLSIAAFLMRTDVVAAVVDLSDIELQLQQTRNDVSQFKQLQSERTELLSRRDTLQSIGLPVEGTRLMGAIGRCMPQGMSLSNVEIVTERSSRPIKDEKSAKLSAIQNRIRVRLQGVTDSGDQVADFFDALNHVAVFEQVRMDVSKVTKNRNLMMRQFEIEFSIEASPVVKEGS